LTAKSVPTSGQVRVAAEAGHSLTLTAEEIAQQRATVEFHAQRVVDPTLRERLDGTAHKLSRLAALAQRS
jgi:hypothetical protein